METHIINENTPMIETERLILRQFTLEDTADLLKIMSDEEVNHFLPWFPLKTFDEAKSFLQKRFLDYYQKQTAYRYAICKKEGNKPIGYMWLSDNESNDFGYGLRKEFWHQGIVTESAYAVLQRIKSAGYLYITATHDVNNPRSGAVMKKIGMTYKYSFVEQVQPKNLHVTFRMYQFNFDGNIERTYMEYWKESSDHFVEKNV